MLIYVRLRLLVKKVLEPEREPSEASAGTNSHQNMDDSQSGPLSPSHYLEVAANTAKTYLHGISSDFLK